MWALSLIVLVVVTKQIEFSWRTMFGERSQVVKSYRELSCSGSANVRSSGQLFEEKKQLSTRKQTNTTGKQLVKVSRYWIYIQQADKNNEC